MTETELTRFYHYAFKSARRINYYERDPEELMSIVHEGLADAGWASDAKTQLRFIRRGLNRYYYGIRRFKQIVQAIHPHYRPKTPPTLDDIRDLLAHFGQTHCRYGHPYETAPRGKRYCPVCENQSKRARRKAKRQPKPERTTCPYGHPYRIYPNGRKKCLVCEAAQKRIRRQKEAVA